MPTYPPLPALAQCGDSKPLILDLHRSSGGSDNTSLRPNSMIRSHSSHLMSPSSDIVGPSPVTSTTSAGTEIEDEATEETARQANVDQAAPSQVGLLGIRHLTTMLTVTSL
jgi:hypothetical protein